MAWLTAFLPADEAVQVMTAIDAIATTTDPDDPRGIDARRADALVDAFTTILDTGIGPAGPVSTHQHRHPHLDVTASATTLLGLDQAPAHLSGYGPIPATMARQIAARSTWQPLLVDERTGTMLARSSHSYRPSPTLTGDVIRRDVTCTFPGCRTPAGRSDIDHLEPFDPGRQAADQTQHTNLHALCRYHHGLKTHGRWHVTCDPVAGTTTWTTPTGHTYTRIPIPADPTAVERITSNHTRRDRPTPEPPPY